MRTKLWGIAAAVTTCVVGGLATAQPLEEIIVEASPVLKTPSKAEGPAPGYYQVAMSSRVSYKDLDLTKPQDVATLDKRIKDAATYACDALGKVYPQSGPDTPECAKRAAERAMVDANKAVAAAKARAK